MDNIFCIECGFELPGAAKFCKKCGVQIEASESLSESKPITQTLKETTPKTSESKSELSLLDIIKHSLSRMPFISSFL